MRFQRGYLRKQLTRLPLSLCDLFNKSLSLGSLLTEWKLANIVPVYKKDNREYVETIDPSHYSALSLKLWSIVCLMLLRIKYIIAWLAAAIANIASWQSVHALRNWLRCLTLLVPSCTRGMSWHYLDMSKAFNKVSHHKLLTLLQQHCFDSYLDSTVFRG